MTLYRSIFTQRSICNML